MTRAWVIEQFISSFYKNTTAKILLSHCGGKCAILWLLSWPIPVFRLLWDFPRFSCEITWLPLTPLLAINKMFEVFARLSSTEGAFQNRLFKIYKNAFFWKITGTETYWDTSETQLKHILITLSNLRMLYLSNWISGMSSSYPSISAELCSTDKFMSSISESDTFYCYETRSDMNYRHNLSRSFGREESRGIFEPIWL